MLIVECEEGDELWIMPIEEILAATPTAVGFPSFTKTGTATRRGPGFIRLCVASSIVLSCVWRLLL